MMMSYDDDNDIYQIRFNWRHDYSARLWTRVGIGPSYDKVGGK